MLVDLINKKVPKELKKAKEQVNLYNEDLKNARKQPTYYEGNSEEKKALTQIELWSGDVKGLEKWKSFKPEFSNVKAKDKEEYYFNCTAEPNYESQSYWNKNRIEYRISIDKQTGNLKVSCAYGDNCKETLPKWRSLVEEE